MKTQLSILVLLCISILGCDPAPEVQLAEGLTVEFFGEGERASFSHAILMNDRYDSDSYHLVAMNSEKELQSYVSDAARLGAPPIPDTPHLSVLIIDESANDPNLKGHYGVQATYYQKGGKSFHSSSGMHLKDTENPWLDVFPGTLTITNSEGSKTWQMQLDHEGLVNHDESKPKALKIVGKFKLMQIPY